MKNGEEIESIVLEIGDNEVKYKKHSNTDENTYTVLKSDIFQIKYENGNRVMFSTAVINTPAGDGDFTVGQRVTTWLINSILPGVGYFAVMKDKNGGLIQLGTAALGYILIGVGVSNIAKGSSSYYVEPSSY